MRHWTRDDWRNLLILESVLLAWGALTILMGV